MLSTLKAKAMTLRAAPRELWMVYLLKFLEAYSYFSMSVILVLYMSEEFLLTDMQAGTIYGLFGMCTSASGFAVGFLVDNLGVKKSLQLGLCLLFLSRVLLAVTTSIFFVKLSLYALMPVGSSLGIPVLTLGIKRYTTLQSRGFAFGIFYAVMNVAALVSGLMVDTLEMVFKPGCDMFGSHFSAKRLLLLSGALATALSLVVASFFREIKVEQGWDEDHSISTFDVQRRSPLTIIADLRRSGAFLRLMAIVVICINLKCVFRYLDTLLPSFLVREFGDDVPKGTIYSINPAMIIVLVPVVAAFTSERAPFDMILYGGWVTGISALPLALNTSIFASVLFMVLLSIGEAAWSPRFYDLTVSMAPEGREGTFLSLSTLPIFAAQLPVGLISGYLLSAYCPKEGERHSTTMWMIILLMTVSSPVLLTVFRSWLRPPDAESGHSLGGLANRGQDNIELRPLVCAARDSPSPA